ncbi:hypothetical protein REPUB_Repub13aG0159300 [Reevesia pubescens]
MSLRTMDPLSIAYAICLVSLITVCSSAKARQNMFNVLSYGAAGNGITDDSLAFTKAWKDTCSAAAGNPTLIIPQGKTFLVHPITFAGPCKSSIINVKLSGTMIAPNGPDRWKAADLATWFVFQGINGLTIDGLGKMDGSGKGWWDRSCKYHPGQQGCITLAPTVLKFEKCSNIHMNNINFQNSPQTHVLVLGCQNVDFGFLTIHSPGTSPNTDGIHIQVGRNVSIHNSQIAAGDDCISIGDSTSGINITDINCGPGHGVSIGSLGRDGTEVQVENINVMRVNFRGTTNGVRIKTWQIGRGLVQNVYFSNINFTAVENPIIIDQFYCDHPNSCRKTDWNHIFHLVLCMLILRSSRLYSHPIINVVDYGAVGDGITDDSQAFIKAWVAVCGVRSRMAVLNVPSGKKFLLKPFQFAGPCKSSYLHVLVGGQIVAPSKLSEWGGHEVSTWLSFQNVNRLIVDGNGVIDSQGAIWWQYVQDADRRPTALEFSSCNNLKLSGLTHINSPRSHISINSCTNVTITNLHIIAPETAHNTDGIDIASSSNVQIRDCYIATGDDCIAINKGCNNINITGVACGPGHGISVGSLGMDGEHAEVNEIRVEHCIFNATQNGARIKTWQGGSGFARMIVFKNISLINAYNPIIIDQYYCIPGKTCKNQKSAVELSSITFTGFCGTSMSEEAIKLSCSENVGCTNILLDHINITSAVRGNIVHSSCINAHGTYIDSIPKVDCLLP